MEGTFVERLPPIKGKGTDGKHMRGGITQKFNWSGSYGGLTGALLIGGLKRGAWGPEGAHIEISVEEGKVRGYLADRKAGGYRYVEATPGKPATLDGDLILIGNDYNFMLEAPGGDAKGVSYRFSR